MGLSISKQKAIKPRQVPLRLWLQRQPISPSSPQPTLPDELITEKQKKRRRLLVRLRLPRQPISPSSAPSILSDELIMEERKKRRRLVVRLQLPRKPFLPDELLSEIISWLPVKQLMQLRCVNKYFKNLVFDPHFVQMHLDKSSLNPQLALMYYKNDECSLKTLPIPRLLQYKTTIFRDDPYYVFNDSLRTMQWVDVVGSSCNGLLCLYGISSRPTKNHWLCLWNPATREKSKKFITTCFDRFHFHSYAFSFGYDNSTQTYKVVAMYLEVKPNCNPKTLLKVFSFGDDDSSWRDIQCSPVVSLYWLPGHYISNKGLHLNGTINWVVVRDNISNRDYVDQYVILSVDLSTETCTQLLLPQRFDEVPTHTPKLVVFRGCLCFCHDFEKTHYVIWQMKDFGAQESWIQLFKISYEMFSKEVDLLPLYLSENGDSVILANDKDKQTFVYNHRYNKVEKIATTTTGISWWQTKNYVESLVSTH